MSSPSWEEQYKTTLETPPKGLITARDPNAEIKMCKELVAGKPPFLYAVAYVHNVVGEEPVWYLQAKDQNQGHGWKVILLPRARQEYFQNPIPLTSLRVVRTSRSRRALLAELP